MYISGFSYSLALGSTHFQTNHLCIDFMIKNAQINWTFINGRMLNTVWYSILIQWLGFPWYYKDNFWLVKSLGAFWLLFTSSGIWAKHLQEILLLLEYKDPLDGLFPFRKCHLEYLEAFLNVDDFFLSFAERYTEPLNMTI